MSDVTGSMPSRHLLSFTRLAVTMTLTLLMITDFTDDFIRLFTHCLPAAAGCFIQLDAVTLCQAALLILILHQQTTDPVTCIPPTADPLDYRVTALHRLSWCYLNLWLFLGTLSCLLSNYQHSRQPVPISFMAYRTPRQDRHPEVRHALVTFTGRWIAAAVPSSRYHWALVDCLLLAPFVTIS